MKILELFSGTESFSKVARERGHVVFTVDDVKELKEIEEWNVAHVERKLENGETMQDLLKKDNVVIFVIKQKWFQKGWKGWGY